MSAGGSEEVRRSFSKSDRTIARRVVRPLQEFLRSSSASAVPLLCAAIVGLIWANSPWWLTYERIWNTPIVLRLGPWAIDQDVRFWVNEGLMTSFFLLAGLEIKREIVVGELRDRGAVLVPVAAAAAGMVVPALLYLAVTHGTEASAGWGMAMPTDVALSLAILVAVGARAARPRARPFLLTLAIADDLLTVIVVAVFYAGRLSGLWLGAALVCAGAMFACDRAHIRHLAPYLVLGAGAWLSAYEGGVHPALVGAALGLLTPARPFQRPARVSAEARRIADHTDDHPDPPEADAASWIRLSTLSREAVSPLARVERGLLPWVNLGALPAFALVNAGVRLAGGWWRGPAEHRLILGLVLARLIGKPAGILGTAVVLRGKRMGRSLRALSIGELIGVALAAGAPFTVSLFVAGTAFRQGTSLLAASQIGVLLAASICGLSALIVLTLRRPRR